jgi:hypothetical protein
LQWKLPAGWEQGPGNQLIKYEFFFGPKDDRLRVTISEARGSLLQNVNRWRDEVGLEPVTSGQLKYATETLNVNGTNAIKVEVTGRLKKRTMGKGF